MDIAILKGNIGSIRNIISTWSQKEYIEDNEDADDVPEEYEDNDPEAPAYEACSDL